MRNYGNPGSLAKVYARLHDNRFEHIEQARRAREAQSALAEAEADHARKVGWLLLGIAIGGLMVAVSVAMRG